MSASSPQDWIADLEVIIALKDRLAEAERLLQIWAGEAGDEGETVWEDTAAFLAATKESK